jgi:hypothetical protein
MAHKTPAAIGFRTHSGWAALMVVAGSPDAPVILERRRIEIADRGIKGSVQPYHAAKELGIKTAADFLERCMDASRSMAKHAIGELAEALKVVRCGIVLGSGRPSPSLEATLASHAAIHTAEGEFFRRALMEASEQCGLSCRGVREKELYAVAGAEFGMSGEVLVRCVNEIGKIIGPPWTQDQKCAALVGWVAIGSKTRPRMHTSKHA